MEELEACGDQVAATGNPFCCKSREEATKKPYDRQEEVVQLARSDRGHLIFRKYFFQDWTKCTDGVSIC